MIGRHRSRHVHGARVRYGRVAAAGAAVAVTLVAVLGGVGLIGHVPRSVASTASAQVGLGGGGEPTRVVDRTPARDGRWHALARERASDALPPRSGQGKRVVFDISRQRVWLVRRGDSVAATYLASGSLTDNLKPGHYHVFSRSRWAVGIDDSGVMQYFVRFAHGKNAAIGFHSIPTKNGKPLQTVAQLGQPESHGCIRQWLPDAIRLWRFAPVGTEVVVTA